LYSAADLKAVIKDDDKHERNHKCSTKFSFKKSEGKNGFVVRK